MILYFTDRFLNILGNASTTVPKTITVTDDVMIEDVESGFTTLECELRYDNDHNRIQIEEWATVGNYILCQDNDEIKLFTIVESENETKKQSVYLYAEDDGMDLLNEVFGEYKADKAYTIDHYINMFAAESGFEIGINEIPTLKKQLEWDDESTAAKRLAETAALFDGAEISFSFEIDRLLVVKRYINIFQKRGKDENTTLRLNFDIDNIITTKSITNLATALQCTGSTIEQDAEILKKAKSSGSPVVEYSVELKTMSRTASTAQIKATITSALTTEKAELSKDYGLKASIYMGGVWHDAIIKATDKDNGQAWSGTTNHSTEYTFSISGVDPGVVTFSDIKFKVARTDSKGGSVGILSSTACGKFKIPNYIKGGENGEDINSRDITIEGYKYDDGDFYVDGTLLKSREAVQTWHRYFWKTDEEKEIGGHIVKLYSYDTDNQATLCQNAIEELKKLREIELNYEIELRELPEHMKIGDRINVVDDEGSLYLSTRLLKIKKSNTNKECTVTLGEHLIKSSGIAQKVADLAAQFTKEVATTKRALIVANNAKTAANNAQQSANNALSQTTNALTTAENANATAQQAAQSASAAETAASNAQTAVGNVQNQVSVIETSVANAQRAAEQAQQAAQTAETKATEAHTAAADAQTKAVQAYSNAFFAQQNAEIAQNTAENAKSKAEQAISDAVEAATTAAAAKLDAEKAKEEIDSLGEALTTVTETMTVEYARKTDLTEAEASLKSQISKNAAQIRSTVSKVERIDETANNAAVKATAAYLGAEEAQALAAKAQAHAEEIQALAEEAQALADEAQAEADIAKAAADTAQSVLDQANADLQAAQADLETVMSRVDATADEIEQAQQAVNAAQVVANTAQAYARVALAEAEAAQATADAAAENAFDAQSEAAQAVNNATIAQQAAAQASGSLASQVQATANSAAQTALNAQSAADAAVSNAQNAQSIADSARQTAESAQSAANKAKTDAAAAQSELNTAKQNLEAVTSRVGATEEEIAAAQQAVSAAQSAADKAKTDAAAAQSAADTAKANATNAQETADKAKSAADAAQVAATIAQTAANAAQSAVDALSVRVTKAETDFIQTNEQIKLLATKEEVTTTLGGYYTKVETDAAISVKSNEINLSVDEKIIQNSDEVREEITGVKSQVLIETEDITLEHLKKYVSNEQFEADLEAYVGAQLKILEDRLTAKVSGVENKTNSVDSDLQDKYNLITKYFDFTINGLEIKSVHTDENGNEVASPYKIVIDNENQTTYANGEKVQIIDAVTGEVLTPKLKVTDAFDLLGYQISKDETTGNVNWEYTGG